MFFECKYNIKKYNTRKLVLNIEIKCPKGLLNGRIKAENNMGVTFRNVTPIHITYRYEAFIMSCGLFYKAYLVLYHISAVEVLNALYILTLCNA